MARFISPHSYKPNPYSSIAAIVNPADGDEEQQRFVNRGKNKIIGVSVVKFHPGVVRRNAPHTLKFSANG